MKQIYPDLEILNTLSFYKFCLDTIISIVILYIKRRLYQLFGNLLNLKGAKYICGSSISKIHGQYISIQNKSITSYLSIQSNDVWDYKIHPLPTLPLSLSRTPIIAFGFKSNAKSAYRSPLRDLHVNYCLRMVKACSIMFLTSSTSLIT